MLNMSATEMIILAVIALLVFGANLLRRLAELLPLRIALRQPRARVGELASQQFDDEVAALTFDHAAALTDPKTKRGAYHRRLPPEIAGRMQPRERTELLDLQAARGDSRRQTGNALEGRGQRVRPVLRENLVLLEPNRGLNAVADLIERRHAFGCDGVDTEDIVGGDGLDHRARFAHRCLERPNTDVGNDVAAKIEAVTLNQRVGRRDLQPQLLRGAIERRGIGALGG